MSVAPESDATAVPGLPGMVDVRPVDVVILGAGVNGAGLFRDLCLQGVSALIVDKGDICSGTSAAPSRLIHGGLKYLETGEFGLVAESTLERNLLLGNAPHYVRPLETVIPIQSWAKGLWPALRTLFGATSVPRSRGALLVKIGLMIYDFYGARQRVMPRHRMIGRRTAFREIPALNPSIVALAAYYDARISHPERLVLELVLDGIAANPDSSSETYATLLRASDGVLAFQRQNGTGFSVRPKLVVNASGPWIDGVNAALGFASTLIGGTKGSHILLKHDALVKSLDGRMLYFEADDGRICLVYDYLGLALVGSTDIKAGDPDAVRCEADEVDYMLASVGSLLPGMTFGRDQIVYAYSGIRPLPTSDASMPGLISRDHSAPVAEPDATRPFAVISLVGGKWTTFRGFAETVADTVLERLGLSRKASTQTLPIGGGRNFPADAAAREAWLADAGAASGLDRARLGELLARYGTRAAALAAHRGAFDDRQRLPDSDAYSLAEIDYIARTESVEHLADIVMRRTTLAIGGTLTARDLEDVAKVAGQALGWSVARRDDEIEALLAQLRCRNLMRFEDRRAAA